MFQSEKFLRVCNLNLISLAPFQSLSLMGSGQPGMVERNPDLESEDLGASPHSALSCPSPGHLTSLGCCLFILHSGAAVRVYEYAKGQVYISDL